MNFLKLSKIHCTIAIYFVSFFTVCTETNAVTLLKRELSDSSYERKNNSSSFHRPVLPKKGDMAVVVKGFNKQCIADVEACIIKELLSNGYMVVDEAKAKKMRAAAARVQAACCAVYGITNNYCKHKS